MNAKLKATWLAGLMAALFVVEPGFAQTSLGVANVPGYPGATVSVPVDLRPASNTVAAQFDVAFNAAKVTALGALRGERLTNHVIRSRQVAPGVQRVLLYSLDNAQVSRTNATLASLSFAVSPAEYVGSGPLTPTNTVLARGDATPVTPLTLNAGTIFVRPVNPLADGTVQFFLPSTPDLQYTIQATTNLINWSNIATNVATGEFMNLLDVEAGAYPFRFYRWRHDP